jgi:cytochrome P450
MMDLMGTTIEGLAVMFPINLPGFHYRKVLAARRELVAEYQEIINEKRLNPVQTSSSMIDYVMGNGKEGDGMSDLELQDFCVNMTFAGHDTTLATMQSLLYYLSAHPTVLAELRSEVDSAWDGKVCVTRALLQSLVKCQAFIMEVLRLTPPVPFMARELSTATTVDGYELPAGMTIMCGLKSIMDHHFAEQGQHIDNLELGRWFDTDGKFVGQAKLYDLASFSIFGAGGRMCIGYKFAMDELIVFLMNLLRSFDFTVSEAKKVCFPFAYWQITAAFRNRSSDGVEIGA